MKKDKRTFTIGRNNNGFYYSDKDTNLVDVAMIEAFGMFLARLAGTIQHAEEVKQNVKYQIEVTRTLTKETTSE